MVYKNLDFGKIWLLLFKMTLKIRYQIRWKVHEFFFLPEAKVFLEFFPNFPVTVSTFCKAVTCTVSHRLYRSMQELNSNLD